MEETEASSVRRESSCEEKRKGSESGTEAKRGKEERKASGLKVNDDPVRF